VLDALGALGATDGGGVVARTTLAGSGAAA